MMEGGELRSFLSELDDELRRARSDFDEINRRADLMLSERAPLPPDKPSLLRKYIEPRRTLRRRSTSSRDEFQLLKERVAHLADTSTIEAVEKRMRETNDPFLTQIACERRRLQLAAGACLTALGRLRSSIERQP